MTKDNTKADLAGLRAFYTLDPVAKVIFDHLSKFVRNMGITKVDQLNWRLSSEPNPPAKWQVLRFFRKLEELCCGKVIEGRRGKKTRFEWSANLVDIARAAQGQDVQIGSASNEIEIEEAAGEQSREEPIHEDLVEHPYLLRKDLHVRLELPADLTAAEAARLAKFIQSLPFDQGNAGSA